MPSISSLTTISKDALSTRGAIIASPEQSFSLVTVNGVNNLNSVVADLEDHHASASEPTDKPAGQTWFDSTNSLWKGYKTLNATSPVTFWTKENAYARTALTAGTATFSPGGALDVNTTQVVVSGGAGDLMTYTIPANTMAFDGDIIKSTMVFSTGSGVTDSDPFFGSSTISLGGPVNGIPCIWKIYILRRGANTQTMFACSIQSIDSAGSNTKKVGEVNATEDLTQNVIIKARQIAASAGATQEIMITRLMP